jgi:C-terminal processing protease CtpA/Prc
MFPREPRRPREKGGRLATNAAMFARISKTNWEGTGVEPDVKVKAADALKTAEKLAERRLQKK